MRIMVMVNERHEVARYLKHIGLAAHPPPIAPARDEQGEFAWNDQDPRDDQVQEHPDYDH